MAQTDNGGASEELLQHCTYIGADGTVISVGGDGTEATINVGGDGTEGIIICEMIPVSNT